MRHALLLAGFVAALMAATLIGQDAKTEAKEENAPAKTEAAAPVTPTADADANADVDKAVVTIDGTKITEKEVSEEFDKRMEAMKQRMGGQPMPDAQKQMMRTRIVDMMVEQTLLEQQLKKKGLSVSDEKVMDEIKTIAGQQGQSMDQIEEQIKQMGMTMQDLRGQIRYKLMMDALVEAEMKDTVGTDDAKKFYDENPGQFERPEQVQASHILIKVEAGATEDAKAEAKKEAEEILKKVKADGDFAALAKEHSDCPSSAQGGDLGLFGRGQMVKEFEETAFGMKPGDISGLVETQFGYHIIKVTDKKEAGKIAFDEVKDDLEKYLTQRKQQEFLQEYREKMKSEAKIEYSAEEQALRDQQQKAAPMGGGMGGGMQVRPQTAPAPQPEQAKPDEIKPKTEEKPAEKK